MGLPTYKFDIDAGGSNISLDLTAQYLAEAGHDVTVLVYDIGKTINPPSKRSYDCETLELHYRTKADGLWVLLRSTRELDRSFDIFHVFDPGLLPLFGLYRARGGKTPVVGRLNNYGVFCSNESRMDEECFHNCTTTAKFTHSNDPAVWNTLKVPKYLFDTHAVPALMGEVDRLLPISPAVGEVYAEIGVKQDHMTVLPNFFEKEFDGQMCESSLDGSPSLLYVGRLTREKGVDTAIDALRYLCPGARLHIVGEGEQADELATLVRQRELSEQVTFHGWVPHGAVAGYYASADFFIHPARWPEPFGRTVLEAMQLGCVPVVSDVGGPVYVVDDSELVFPADSPKDLAISTQTIYADQAVYEKKQHAMSQRLDRFAPGRVIDDLQTIYQDATAAP